MKNLTKLLGIIALATVMGFSFTACESPANESPHVHQWGEWEGTVTCDEGGTGTRTCLLDPTHTETNDNLQPLGHNYQNWATTTAPTCTTAGVETGTCTYDNAHTTTRAVAINPNAHNWQQSTGTAPTCTVDGNGDQVCSYNEEHIQHGVIPKLGHDWKITEVTKAATCTNPGDGTKTCKRENCGESQSGVGEIPIDPNAHNYNTWRQTTAPTCEATGIESEVCAYNNSHTSGTTRAGAAATGHNWNTTYTTISIVSATTDGVEAITCKDNSAHTKDERITYATGTAGLEYELINDGNNVGTYRVRKGTVSGGAVYIPAYHRPNANSDYKPVTEIGKADDGSQPGAGAFYSTSITSVTIPEGVTTIYNCAFQSCRNLTSVTIPASVTTIGNYAFRDCTRLASVTIGAGVTTIGSYAFQNCTGLASVTFAEGSQLETINGFYNCTGLASITIPNSVTSTGNSAFYNWTNSQTIYVEGYASQVAADAAWGANWRTSCNAVIVYGIRPTSTYFTVTNTNEWNTALSTIAGYSGGGSYTIHVNGSFNVAGSANNTFGTTANGSTLTVTLIGNGTVSLSSNGSLLRAGANQTIIIDSENLILRGRSGNDSSLVYVDGSSAKLELKNGKISGNSYRSTYSCGGGVYVNSGTFTMSGGEISGNTMGGSGDWDNYAYGGGVYNTGTFIMSGGKISDNTIDCFSTTWYRSDSYGGGVYNAGTFTMTGGTISGNKVTARSNYSRSYGGGVYVSSGTFTMSGGTISGNTAISQAYYDASFSGQAVSYGGGVYVYSGTFRIVTGIISGNTVTATTSNSSSYTEEFGPALYGTAQRGTFSIPGDITSTWNSMGTLSTNTTGTTINVVNGNLQ